MLPRPAPLPRHVHTSLSGPRWAQVPKTFATEVTTSIRVCKCCALDGTLSVLAVHRLLCTSANPLIILLPVVLPHLCRLWVGWTSRVGVRQHRLSIAQRSQGWGNPELSLVNFRRSRLHLDGGKNTSDGVDGLPLVLDYVETQNTICVYCTRWRKGQQRMQ